MLRRSPDSVMRADVHAVDLDRAGLRIEDAVQQRQRRRFAGAGGADQRDGLARQRGEGQIGDRGALAVIGEGDVLELDQSAHAAGIDRIGAVAHRRHGVEHVEELLQPRRFHHHVVGEVDHLLELADQHGGEAHEHDDLADRGAARAYRSQMPRIRIASMVSVVDARVITVASAHQASTGIWAPSTWSPSFFMPATSDSMRAKLWTRAMLPSVSVVRSATSL